MEVGCLGTWGLEPPTLNPGSKNTPKACPNRNPAPAQAPVTLNREFSGEIRTIIILLLIIIRGEEGGKKTLKLSKTPQTLRIVKLQAHVNQHA